ncbi:hypothetical protein GMSM_30320 [Geomonas sp. Red276]
MPAVSAPWVMREDAGKEDLPVLLNKGEVLRGKFRFAALQASDTGKIGIDQGLEGIGLFAGAPFQEGVEHAQSIGSCR